jgi:hypothetical protein
MRAMKKAKRLSRSDVAAVHDRHQLVPTNVCEGGFKNEKLPNEPILNFSICLQPQGIMYQVYQTSAKNEPILLPISIGCAARSEIAPPFLTLPYP